MERAGVEDMPEDAERKGLGTPATRAGILEKLVSTGLVERVKKEKKTVLIPHRSGQLPDYRPAGATAIPAFDRRMGTTAFRDSERRMPPG